MSSRVFVCYARADQAFALPLAEHLKARGVSVFVDQWDIPAEQDWDRSIDRALRECAHLLIVLSPASVDSREVRGELRTALDLGKPVLPVLHQPCEIPRQLRVVQFVDFTGKPAGDEPALNRVMRALGAPLEEPASAGLDTPPQVPPPSPRPGARFAGLRALSVKTKAAVGGVLVLLVAGLAWFGLDMATEARRRLNDAALSPDGAYLATATGQGLGVRGAVRVWQVASGREAAFIPVDGPPWVCVWSPDGKTLAVGEHSGRIQLVDSATWRTVGALTGSRDAIDFLAWSPDSTALATGDSKGTLWVWEAETGVLRYSKPVHAERISAVSWTRDGSLLATGSWDRTVAVVNAPTGDVVQQFQGHGSFVTTVSFSPDGARVASGSLEAPFVIVWDRTGSRRDLTGPGGQVERVAWSADGRFLAAASTDNLVHLWNARLDLVRRINLEGQFNSGTGLAWSAEGARLAAGDGVSVQILDPARDVPVSTLAERSGFSYDSIEIAGWSADGKRLGTFSKFDDISGVWDVERATRLQRFSVGLWRSLTE
ncbi:MAG TPA: TIR domain-containing protein [Vicinamibacterales bacterium]|nr:TIR domain-containing protein [Vicinamibacterales bacterium]